MNETRPGKEILKKYTAISDWNYLFTSFRLPVCGVQQMIYEWKKIWHKRAVGFQHWLHDVF